MPSPLIYLGLPHYGTFHQGTLNSVLNAARQCRVMVKATGFSLISVVFNMLWCAALNARSAGVTHFAMLHSDIECEPGWLDTLFWELVRTDADVLSVAVAIKDERGLTSTALTRDPADIWRIDKRISLHELADLPETFSGPDCGDPDYVLLGNTGCWIARLDRPWCEQVCFTVRDRIVKNAKGEFEPHVDSEDWGFSRQLHALGCKVLATKKVKVSHHGDKGWANHGESKGTWETDEANWEAKKRQEGEPST